MSKRNNNGPTNTLFNYFSKTPPSNKKLKTGAEDFSSPKLHPRDNENETKNENKKRERPKSSPLGVKLSHYDDDDEVPTASKKRKRIRIVPMDSDDSDVENKVDNEAESPKEEKKSVEKKLQDSFKYEPNQSPKNPPQRKSAANTGPKSNPSKAVVEEMQIESVEGNWVHCKLEFLKPDKIKDAMQRRPDHPDFDPSTLYVPSKFMNEQTPGHRQWWLMKSSNYDCVLFFKVGKFYELYHMDAAVGVNELGFSYMKGDFAHSGFPESAYGRMASTLVSKGYKVARVEQTETPETMQERLKMTIGQVTKHDKVVRREICQITTRGTQVSGIQDSGPRDEEATYMMTIAEEENNGCSTYGVCFVDTSIGLFHLGQFVDDKHSSRLLTALAHYPTALITYDRKTTSSRTKSLVSTHCHTARREPQNMWTSEKTLQILAEQYYKTNNDGEWPHGIKEFLYEGDALGLTPAKDSYLAIKALGGCVSYLRYCLLDIQVLEMSQFTSYSPPDVLNRSLSLEDKVDNRWEGSNSMVLDAITLKNLRIVQDTGCLYDRLNFCSTPMGKRLLYQWVCAPSCNLTVINERQEAVKQLFENQQVCQEAKSVLTSLPDLERLLAKVHAFGNLKRSKEHPDSRAIFYEEKIYSKRKVLDFISVLNGFSRALKLVELFSDIDSVLLKILTQHRPDGKYPEYTSTLKFFRESFNEKEAEKEGRILPGAGVDQEYDAAITLIKEIEEELKQYLSEQEKHFRCRLNYINSYKKRYQIEVPENAVNKADTKYNFEGARKGFKRFSTQETLDFAHRMVAAEEQKGMVLKDISRRIFEKFSSNYDQWEAAVQCIANLDVLLSFAEYARQQSGDVCLPRVTFDKQQKPYLKINEGRHPCISMINEFIPNDTGLGVDDNERLLLLTGPNMGGKSTLMRQIGLLTVLAHLGSYVPAEECSMSLVDRIFTRLGASDDILSGQSTFLVEMNETAAIVRHATVHSLVLLDELGRGTSTYDGTAIASGVCVELADRQCRVVFSTHYHTLVHHLASHPRVQLGHMACMVETDESTSDNEDDISEETITFLYKLSPGACPKSYGFNAARLAGIPTDITRNAHKISKKLEIEAKYVHAFKQIMKTGNDLKSVRELLDSLCI